MYIKDLLCELQYQVAVENEKKKKRKKEKKKRKEKETARKKASGQKTKGATVQEISNKISKSFGFHNYLLPYHCFLYFKWVQRYVPRCIQLTPSSFFYYLFHYLEFIIHIFVFHVSII